MRGSLGLPKISRDSLDIFEGCAVSADGGAGSAAGAEPAADADSGDVVRLGIGNAGGVGGVGIAFELFEKINNKRIIISIIFPIFSSKSSRINLSNNVIGNSGFFIIIMIFFNNSSNSFESKKINSLNIIFFFNYISLRYRN